MRTALAALLAAAALTGCAGEPDRNEVVVLAASSLTDVMSELADRFEAQRPGTTVVVSTGASSTLAQQVVSGAPADVFAAASPATMQVVLDAGEAAGEPVVVARNRLQLAVPPGNPGRVRGLADLAQPGLAVAVCARQVPCGAAAEKAFTAAGVTPSVDTYEQDVRAVLAKVRLGEVDAGLVYVTDVRSAGEEVAGIALPEAQAAVSDYPAVVLRGGANAEAGRAFLDLLTSDEGRAVLQAAGFLPPG